MKIKFLGGAGTVTGSKTLVESCVRFSLTYPRNSLVNLLIN